MKKKVLVRKLPEDVSVVHPNPLLNRIYIARGVKTATELEYELKYLLPYHDLNGVNGAVDLLVQALHEQWSIVIVGDFDTDGATSTALLVLALRKFGLQNVDYFIPNRFQHGYGLNSLVVETLALKQPQLIITVDNGTTSIEGVERAHQLGIKVLITDHHLVGEQLPEADALVNPHQVDDHFASKNLAGVGVAFYLMIAFRAKLRELNWFTQHNLTEPNLANFLDLVAVGTIADAVPLDWNNRILVTQGLKRIQQGNCRLLFPALLAVAKRDYHKVSPYDLGFIIAPRLNAVGRLGDMILGVDALLADDPLIVHQKAQQLDQLNEQRRMIEGEMYAAALEQLANEKLADGVVLYNDHWHLGVIGILASRLKDKLQRPIAVFTQDEQGELRGSLRSVTSLNLRELLHTLNERNPAVMVKYGGHSMAAGVTVAAGYYDAFCKLFTQLVREHLAQQSSPEIIWVDGILTADDVDFTTAELLQQAGPWGTVFEIPSFYGEFKISKITWLNGKHLKLLLNWPNGDEINAIHFNSDPEQFKQQLGDTIQAIYHVGINEYNGIRTIQLTIKEII